MRVGALWRRPRPRPPAAAVPDRAAFEAVWRDPRGMLGIARTIQNIPISTRYMVTAFGFFLAAGAMAVVMRLQLVRPHHDLVSLATYNQLFTMHGTTMMFLFVIPFLEALAAYMLPLMLGTRELPFPRMTAFSFWTYLFGGLFLFAGFVAGQVPDAGWFAYVPLSGPRYSPGLGMDFWDIGLSVAEVAALGAAAEMIVGVLRMRAPGMSLARLPLFAWSMLVTGVMIIFAFTPLIVGTAMLELDRKGITRFFDSEAGGSPLLWQHLFWIFGHPEVYIMFVPAVGIVSQVVQTFAGRPLVGYPFMVLALLATAFIGFGLWVHHMFTTGLAPLALAFFTVASMMIAIPAGVQVFGWLLTLGTGRPRWHPALLFVAGFVVIFVMGGLTGVMLASVPFNWQAHDSHFVVAHLHYVLIGGVVFPFFAGLYYWFPKMTGRLLSERLGRWNFWLMFVFFHVTFFPMHVVGLLGMPRRVGVYAEGLGWTPFNAVSTAGACGFAAAVLLLVVNVGWSLRRGPAAGPNPWGADTLEWSEPSPPPEAQFPEIPVVAGRHPLWMGHVVELPDPTTRAAVALLRSRPTGWRGALVVSAVEARPVAIVHAPGPTVFPLVLALGFLGLFVAALLDSVPIATVGAVVSLGGLAGWFWPRTSEDRALAELGDPRPGRLPLAMAGPLSNGWWATVVTVLVLATALITLVASFVYLGAMRGDAPATALAPGLAATATAARLAAGGAALAAARSVARGATVLRRLTLAAALAGSVTFVALVARGYEVSGLRADLSAHASAVLALLGFECVVTAIIAGMLVMAQLWTWRRPHDPRGHAVVLNAALLEGFAVVSWLVVLGLLILAPRAG